MSSPANFHEYHSDTRIFHDLRSMTFPFEKADQRRNQQQTGQY